MYNGPCPITPNESRWPILFPTLIEENNLLNGVPRGDSLPSQKDRKGQSWDENKKERDEKENIEEMYGEEQKESQRGAQRCKRGKVGQGGQTLHS